MVVSCETRQPLLDLLLLTLAKKLLFTQPMRAPLLMLEPPRDAGNGICAAAKAVVHPGFLEDPAVLNRTGVGVVVVVGVVFVVVVVFIVVVLV